MRITIDTELQAIIVPDSYYMQVDKLNEIITSVKGNELDYKEYIKTCFDNAYETQIIRQSDVAKMKGTNTKKRKPTAKADDKSSEAKPEDKPAHTAEGEKK